MSKRPTDANGAPVYGMSGGPFEELAEGWALLAREGGDMWQGTPHYWRRIERTERYIALCGLQGFVGRTITGQRVIFYPGDFIEARCSKCGLKRSKEVSGKR